jgi:hypothetical protein
MTNAEARMTKEAQKTDTQPWVLSSFGPRHSFVIRASAFVIISVPCEADFAILGFCTLTEKKLESHVGATERRHGCACAPT